jgi:hypothetical protein
MAGGGKGGKKGPSMQEQLAAQQQAMAMAKPSPVQLQTSGYGGMGINLPQNPQQMGTAATGIGTQAPSWMQGDWAAPWWGQQAPNVGAAMMQQQDPAAYAAQMGQGNVAQPQVQAQAQQAPQGRQTPLRGKAGRLQMLQQRGLMDGANAEQDAWNLANRGNFSQSPWMEGVVPGTQTRF